MGDEGRSNKGKDVTGIKLFGKTITLQNSSRKLVIREDDDDDRDKDDQTVENMKRPEKIIACPRCKSMETKFCYFNNYNVNQPRHFCKGCQRYWTAGGALRNVPVGAGRRKAKPPPSNCRTTGIPSEGCLYDPNSNDHIDFHIGLVVQDWHVPPHPSFRQLFPAVKRHRTDSGSHTCA